MRLAHSPSQRASPPTDRKGRIVKTSGDGILIKFPSAVERHLRGRLDKSLTAEVHGILRRNPSRVWLAESRWSW
jgi:hypothetical protein